MHPSDQRLFKKKFMENFVLRKMHEVLLPLSPLISPH